MSSIEKRLMSNSQRNLATLSKLIIHTLNIFTKSFIKFFSKDWSSVHWASTFWTEYPVFDLWRHDGDIHCNNSKGLSSNIRRQFKLCLNFLSEDSNHALRPCALRALTFASTIQHLLLCNDLIVIMTTINQRYAKALVMCTPHVHGSQFIKDIA